RACSWWTRRTHFQGALLLVSLLLITVAQAHVMPDGTIPTYRIPAFLKLDERSEHGKKTKCIFAISVAYLQRRLGVVLADGRHVREEVMRELYGGGANASISADV